MKRLKRMFLFAVLVLAAAPSWTQASTGQDISSDQVGFYRVPLACPAVRNLGCGSAAKPVLLAPQEEGHNPGSMAGPPGDYARNRVEKERRFQQAHGRVPVHFR